MYNLKKKLATVMATMCSASALNFTNAWGHVGITNEQIGQIQSEFDKVWQTLQTGTDEHWNLPEDQIMDAARSGKIDLNCVVIAKIVKNILVQWNIIGTTMSIYREDDSHICVVCISENGEPLVINFWDKGGDIPKMEVENLQEYVDNEAFTIPTFNDEINRFGCQGFSVGIWLRMVRSQIENEIQTINDGKKLNSENKNSKALHDKLNNYIKQYEEKGSLFLQPAVFFNDSNDKSPNYLIIPTEFDKITLSKLDSYLKHKIKRYKGYFNIEKNYKRVKYKKLSKKLPQGSYRIIRLKRNNEFADSFYEEFLGYKYWLDKNNLEKNEFVDKYDDELKNIDQFQNIK